MEESKIVTLKEEFVADLETPISLYQKVRAAGRGKASFLLESGEGGEKIARRSILGWDPFLTLRCRQGAVELAWAGGRTEKREGNPLRVLQAVLKSYRFSAPKGYPPFFGGAVGYLGYDLVRYVESLPNPPPDDLGLPDAVLIFPRVVAVYDHLLRRVQVIVNQPVEEKGEAVGKLAEAVAMLRGKGPSGPPAPQAPPNLDYLLDGAGHGSNFSREGFETAVRRAKEYIEAGDVFQVVLSQRLEVPFLGDAFNLYRAMRAVNPSPYLFFLEFPEVTLVGASPERMVSLDEDGVLEIRPIAGTRPRGKAEEEDLVLERELLADEKERAEHVMLVDLARNDLGRVARRGTVRVVRQMFVERYSHVCHLVSEVQGSLRAGLDAVDVLGAAMPAGTLSGAPKVRAMEIIDELEPVRRGPYGGAVGYFGFNGKMDTCITIRTIMLYGGRAYVQAGAGIVADSDPGREYQESLNKAGAALEVLRRGEEILG